MDPVTLAISGAAGTIGWSAFATIRCKITNTTQRRRDARRASQIDRDVIMVDLALKRGDYRDALVLASLSVAILGGGNFHVAAQPLNSAQETASALSAEADTAPEPASSAASRGGRHEAPEDDVSDGAGQSEAITSDILHKTETYTGKHREAEEDSASET